MVVKSYGRAGPKVMPERFSTSALNHSTPRSSMVYLISAGFWQRVFAPIPGVFIDLLEDGAALGIRRGHDVAIHVAAGGDGVEQHLVHALHQWLHIAFEDAVELKSLPCGDAQRGRGEF